MALRDRRRGPLRAHARAADRQRHRCLCGLRRGGPGPDPRRQLHGARPVGQRASAPGAARLPLACGAVVGAVPEEPPPFTDRASLRRLGRRGGARVAGQLGGTAEFGKNRTLS